MRRYAHRCINLIIIATVLMVTTYIPVAHAAPSDTECTESRLRDLGVAITNCAGNTAVCALPGANSGQPRLAAGTKIYMLGDSITNAARGDIEQQIVSKGYAVSKINADPGRAISTDTAGSDPSGLQAVDQDQTIIADSGAIVIALGTNSGVEDLNIQIPALISKIRAINGSAPIFWVNLFYQNNLAGRNSRNAIISSNASALGYNVIDTTFANIEIQAGDPMQAHPTAAGNAVFAATIATQLATSTLSTGIPGSATEEGVHEIVGGTSTDGTPSHILSYLTGLDEQKAADAINVYIETKKPESPFVGLGSAFIEGGKKFNVNPFLAVGHLEHENGFATAPSGWHTTEPPSYNAFGRSASESQPHTIYTTASGRERLVYRWTSWQASLDGNNGSEDPWFALINRKYLGNTEGSFRIASGDFETYISHYAPGSDGNNESAYVAGLKATIDGVVALMEGGAVFTGGTPAGGCGISAGKGSTITINGQTYAFPLAPQTKQSYSTLPCTQAIAITPKTTYQDKLLCHHDGTPAFDLSFAGVAGKSVYVIVGGTIDKVNTQDPGWCQSIQLKGNDGFYYWYGHLTGLTVSEGAAVTAGQEMGKVADWTEEHTCGGTSDGDHLHLDRGCSIDGVPQRGGNDDCRDPEFILFMNQFYEALPG